MPSAACSAGNGWFTSDTVYGFPATAERESSTTLECSGSFTIGELGISKPVWRPVAGSVE